MSKELIDEAQGPNGDVADETPEDDLFELVADYSDTIEQLPLEVARDFILLKDLEGQAQDVCQSLKQDLLRLNESLRQSGQEWHGGRTAGPKKKDDEMTVQTQSNDAQEKHVELARSTADKLTSKERLSEEAVSEKKMEVSDSVGYDEQLAEILFKSEDEPQTAMKRNPNTHILTNISSAMDSLLTISEEKHGLALATYNTVDRHIRRMDDALAALEEEIVVGVRSGTGVGRLDGEGLSAKIGVAGLDDKNEHEDAVKSRSARKRKGKRGRKGRKGHNESDEGSDPAEPRYCYCNGVSSGNMVACDNEDCEREWFHYECLGISVPPKGRWFCRDCTELLGPAWKQKH